MKMIKHIGTKEVLAAPMLRGEYNIYRKWSIPENENPLDEGFLVEYLDSPNSNHENHKNYISWSPKDVFKRSYNENGNLTFGQALLATEQGKLIARKGWNGKGMFVFMRPADELPLKMVVQQVKSLPQSVKDYFHFNCNDENGLAVPLEKGRSVKFTSYLCMKAADNTIVNGWLASQTDMLSKDWMILE